MADKFNKILSTLCKKFVQTKKNHVLDMDNTGMSDAVKQWNQKSSNEPSDAKKYIENICDGLRTIYNNYWYLDRRLNNKSTTGMYEESKDIKDINGWKESIDKGYDMIEKACSDLANHKLVIGSLYVGVGTAKYWKQMAQFCHKEKNGFFNYINQAIESHKEKK